MSDLVEKQGLYLIVWVCSVDRHILHLRRDFTSIVLRLDQCLNQNAPWGSNSQHTIAAEMTSLLLTNRIKRRGLNFLFMLFVFHFCCCPPFPQPSEHSGHCGSKCPLQGHMTRQVCALIFRFLRSLSDS